MTAGLSTLPRGDESELQNVSLPATQRLRIAIVSDALPQRNGVGTYYHDLVQHLRPHVARIELICPPAGRRADHEWFSMPMPGDGTQRLAWPSPRWLRGRLEEIEPQVVVVPTLGAYAYLAMQIAMQSGWKTCVAHHTDFEQLAGLYWNRFVQLVCRPSLRYAQGWLLKQADMVITMNSRSWRNATDQNPRAVRIVGTPVAQPFLTDSVGQRHQNLQRVVFIGRLAAEKGVTSILDAAAELPQLQFVIGGDGPLRDQVMAASRMLPNLEYRGWLSRHEVLHAIDEANLLVLPSHFETFGTVALEAMIRGRNVLVAANCGAATWSCLTPGLFVMNEGEMLADALRRLLEMSSTARDRVAERGRAAAVAFHEGAIRDWLYLLAEVSGLPRPQIRSVREVA